jgi:hypothetical protein
MTHAISSEHGNGGAAGSTLFSPAEIETFKSEDRAAGAAIVGLMAGIFTLGLIGYLLVAWWVG